ncbi:MAG: hypothetical protein H6708_05125 [Kofleriaceae bacterium]|nr:hypothetical protein [Myxococcales bacterium]MCB9559770.1 hypothetical protein [Kofleriaceae bacterium]
MSHHHGRRARRGPSLLAGSALAFFALLGLGALVTGCQVTNSNYCCSNAASCGDGNAVSACADPARPYCDDSGAYGPSHTCIADPQATDCGGPDDCTAERPFCTDGTCVQCEGNDDCDDATPVCGDAHLCTVCGGDDDCTGRVGATRCLLDTGACVACLAATDCVDATSPVCDEDSHACRGCAADSECDSQVCNTGTGACVDEADVIYLSASGQGSGTCTRGAPCNTFALGLAQVTGGRNVIKAAPGSYTGAITIDGLTVSILADGATVQPSPSTVPVLTISNGADVTLEGITLTGVIGSGLTVAASCSQSTLTMHRSTLIANTGGGGLLITGCEFSLVNNVIALNGGLTSTFGGMRITDITTVGTHELRFNTITANGSVSNTVSGVECTSIATPLVFENNIVYANVVQGSGTQIGDDADCSWRYSDIGPQTVAGTGNINADPLFVDPATRDFHLMAGSPAQDVADPAATDTVDIDGDARPQGDRADMGADEITP